MLEQQLQILIKQEHAQANARLSEIQKNFDEVEWQMVHQELNELVDELLPRFFRCPFLVMLWATYESGVIHISKYIQNKKGLSLSIGDIKGASFLKKANKYFQHVIKFSLFTDKKTEDRLDMLRILRNTTAHCNGRIKAIKNPKDINKIKTWEKGNFGISTISDNLVFTEIFLRQTYSLVRESLDDLINRTKQIKFR